MRFTPSIIHPSMSPSSDVGIGAHMGFSLDLAVRKYNIYAFGKLWFSYDDKY